MKQPEQPANKKPALVVIVLLSLIAALFCPAFGHEGFDDFRMYQVFGMVFTEWEGFGPLLFVLAFHGLFLSVYATVIFVPLWLGYNGLRRLSGKQIPD